MQRSRQLVLLNLFSGTLVRVIETECLFVEFIITFRGEAIILSQLKSPYNAPSFFYSCHDDTRNKTELAHHPLCISSIIKGSHTSVRNFEINFCEFQAPQISLGTTFVFKNTIVYRVILDYSASHRFLARV